MLSLQIHLSEYVASHPREILLSYINSMIQLQLLYHLSWPHPKQAKSPFSPGQLKTFSSHVNVVVAEQVRSTLIFKFDLKSVRFLFFSSRWVSSWVEKNIFGIAFKSENIPWGSELRKIKTFNMGILFNYLGSISERRVPFMSLVSLAFSILNKDISSLWLYTLVWTQPL